MSHDLYTSRSRTIKESLTILQRAMGARIAWKKCAGIGSHECGAGVSTHINGTHINEWVMIYVRGVHELYISLSSPLRLSQGIVSHECGAGVRTQTNGWVTIYMRVVHELYMSHSSRLRLSQELYTSGHIHMSHGTHINEWVTIYTSRRATHF